MQTLLAVGLLLAQGPVFEVASVKPVQERTGMAGSQVSGDSLSIRYTTVSSVMFQAYELKFPGQIEGPSWIRSERYDIQAKCPGRCEEVPAMLRALLAERFKLVAHHERKEFTEYALLVGSKGTPRLKPDEDKPWETFSAVDFQKGHRMAKSMSMKMLAVYCGMMTQSAVSDETGLTGHYDFPLDYSVEERGSKTGDWPSIFTIVEELGLKLRARKTMFDVVVVDGGNKVPVEN